MKKYIVLIPILILIFGTFVYATDTIPGFVGNGNYTETYTPTLAGGIGMYGFKRTYTHIDFANDSDVNNLLRITVANSSGEVVATYNYTEDQDINLVFDGSLFFTGAHYGIYGSTQTGFGVPAGSNATLSWTDSSSNSPWLASIWTTAGNLLNDNVALALVIAIGVFCVIFAYRFGKRMIIGR